MTTIDEAIEQLPDIGSEEKNSYSLVVVIRNEYQFYSLSKIKNL